MENLRSDTLKLYKKTKDLELELKDKFYSACTILNKELKEKIENKVPLLMSWNDNSITLNNGISIEWEVSMQCEDFEELCPEIEITISHKGKFIRCINYCFLDNIYDGYDIPENSSIVEVIYDIIIGINL